MAVALYRRLPRVVFQSAVISNSKFAWSKPPIQFGRKYLSKSAAACARYKDLDPPDLAPESLVGYDAAKYIRKRGEENEVDSFDNHRGDFIKPPKTFSTGTPFSRTKKKWGLSLDHQEPTSARVRKVRSLKDIETFNTKEDPRCFQSHRPEYKSMTFSLECPVETPIEEGVRILEEDTSGLTPSEVSEQLIKLSRLPRKELVAITSRPQFKNLCKQIASSVSLYTNSEVVGTLRAFARLNIYTKHPMPKEYEQELCLRVWKLSTDDLLLVADTLRYMGLKVSTFLDIMYKCMEERYLDLSLPQVVQLMYIIGEGRYAPPDLLKKVETMVERYISTFHVEEIGAVCLGFFKTQNGLSKPLVVQIGDILVERMEHISNYSLVSVLKMFRFTRVDHLAFFDKVGQEANERIPDMSVQSIMHVVLAFAAMHILNKELLNVVATVIPERLSYCRSKDLAKYLWSFGIFKYKPPNANAFYSSFLIEIRRNLTEFLRYPEHFLTCLMGLAFCQQFPYDLINIALSEKFIKQSSKVSLFELKKDIYTIAGTVEIECPQYTGNTISAQFRQEVEDLLEDDSGQDIHTKSLVIKTGCLLQEVLGGPEYVKEHMILPHTRTKDFEVHLNINRKPIPLKSLAEDPDKLIFKKRNIEITDDLLLQLTKTSKKNSQDEDHKPVTRDLSMTDCSREENKDAADKAVVTKLAIQVTNRNQYVYGSKELLGLHTLKRRQLRKLGYVVVEMPYWEWFPLQKHTHAEKLAYLQDKVYNSY